MTEPVTFRRRSDRFRAELCTFEKVVCTGELTTFRFFLLHSKPIVADLQINKHAELLQAAFKLCNVDEKNVLNLVGISYQSVVGQVDSEGHRKLTEEECTQLTFYDPTPLLDDVVVPEVIDGEVWVLNVSKEFVYPRGEDSYDIWFHDLDHHGRQAVLNVVARDVEKLTEDLYAIRLGHMNHMLEYAVLRPNGIFQKCHGHAGALGGKISFAVQMAMNQSTLSVKYPFVPRPRRSGGEKTSFTPIMTPSGTTRLVTPVQDAARTRRVARIRDFGDTICVSGKHLVRGGNIK